MENIFYIKISLMLLSAAIIVVTLFNALKLSPVLGYFVAGAAIGKYGFSFINPGAGIAMFGELGIVFLLFVIGLELTLERLVAMKNYILAGTLQIVTTSSIVYFVCYKLWHISSQSAIIAGGLSLSSTAIVLQVLKDNGMQSTKIGRLAVAILLMQDFVVVPMLVFIPHLTNAAQDSSLLLIMITTFSKAAIGLILVFVFGRILFRPIFNIIAYFESEELFIATTILIVLGSAYATEKMGLSMALGAFVAGLVVAETTHRHAVEKVVMPFKALFLGLFFMTVGMSLDIMELINKISKISIIVFSIILIKSIIIYVISRIFGCNNKTAIHAGLLLSQSGEFAFILFDLSLKQGILSTETAQILMISVTVTMALTPLLSFIGSKINYISEEDEKIEILSKDEFEIDKHVVIIGISETSKLIANTLIEENINFAILDINPDLVIKYKKEGYPVYYGNVNDEKALKKVNIENAIVTILVLKNEVTIKKAISSIKSYSPKTKLVVRAQDDNKIEEYRKSGIYFLMPYYYEKAFSITSVILKIYGYDEPSIDKIKDNFINKDCITEKLY